MMPEEKAFFDNIISLIDEKEFDTTRCARTYAVNKQTSAEIIYSRAMRKLPACILYRENYYR
jgi:hypothetical protein